MWGSTYLAIRYAVQTIPPFIMGGLRFVVSGALLYVWARFRGAPRPTRLHWRNAVIAGGFLLLGGNGAVVWAEQFVPSGLTALLVSILPFWLVIIEWVRPPRLRPHGAVLFGLILGFIGIIVLVGPSNLGGRGDVRPLGALVLILGSLSWAIGSFWSRDAELPESGLLTTGMEMLGGGVLLLIGMRAYRGALNEHTSHLRRVRRRTRLSHHVRLADWIHLVHLAARQSLAGTTRDVCVRESHRRSRSRMGNRRRAVVGPHRRRSGDRDLCRRSDNDSSQLSAASNCIVLR